MQTGFSLIELLITIAIVAILSTISYPIYTQHILHAKERDTAIALSNLASALETYALDHGGYQGASFSNLKTGSLVDNSYRLSIQSNQTHYMLQARRIEPINNNPCNTLSLNSLGNRSPLACWQ